MKKDIQVIKH